MQLTVLAISCAVAILGLLFIAVRGMLIDTFIVLLVTLAYCSAYAQTLVPVRYILAAAALAIIVTLIARSSALSPRQRRLGVLIIVLSLFSYGVFYLLIDKEFTDQLLRYSVLFPLMATCGFLLARSGSTRRLERVYVFVSCIMGLLAVVERITGKFLVAGSYANSDRLTRDGSIRSIVFSEHPLVLSVLLLASIPLISRVLSRSTFRTMAFCVLLAGIVSTNSRGALIMLACWISFILVRKAGLFGRGASRVARFGAVGAILFLFIGSLFASDADQLASSNSLDASAEYRSSLYLFAARSLLTMPAGWGIGGLPEGIYYVSSAFGPLDLSRTVDSELALAVFDFGLIGLIGFGVLIIALLNSRRLNMNVGQSALIITASGFYLALHSWTGLGSIWMVFAGVVLGISYAPNGTGATISGTMSRKENLPQTSRLARAEAKRLS